MLEMYSIIASFLFLFNIWKKRICKNNKQNSLWWNVIAAQIFPLKTYSASTLFTFFKSLSFLPNHYTEQAWAEIQGGGGWGRGRVHPTIWGCMFIHWNEDLFVTRAALRRCGPSSFFLLSEKLWMYNGYPYSVSGKLTKNFEVGEKKEKKKEKKKKGKKKKKKNVFKKTVSPPPMIRFGFPPMRTGTLQGTKERGGYLERMSLSNHVGDAA